MEFFEVNLSSRQKTLRAEKNWSAQGCSILLKTASNTLWDSARVEWLEDDVNDDAQDRGETMRSMWLRPERVMYGWSPFLVTSKLNHVTETVVAAKLTPKGVW